MTEKQALYHLRKSSSNWWKGKKKDCGLTVAALSRFVKLWGFSTHLVRTPDPICWSRYSFYTQQQTQWTTRCRFYREKYLCLSSVSVLKWDCVARQPAVRAPELELLQSGMTKHTITNTYICTQLTAQYANRPWIIRNKIWPFLAYICLQDSVNNSSCVSTTKKTTTHKRLNESCAALLTADVCDTLMHSLHSLIT